MESAQQARAGRRRRDKTTAADVLHFLREVHDVFRVHKYRWSETNLRRLTRRMVKDGKLELLGFDGTHFHYRIPK